MVHFNFFLKEIEMRIRPLGWIIFIAVLLGLCFLIYTLASPFLQDAGLIGGEVPPTQMVGDPLQPTKPDVGAFPTDTPFEPVEPSPEQPTEPEQPVVVEDPAEGMPKVVVGLDAFAPYYTVLLAKAMHLDAKWGIDIEPIAFYSSDETSFDEAARSEMLSTGQWDVLFTTSDKPSLRPQIGQVVAYTDETDGADKLICNDSVPGKILNALKGKRISFLAESIGEFAVYYYLNIPKIPVTDVALVPNYDGVAAYDDDGNVVGGAVYDFITGKVDCVSGWEPDVDFALDYGGHVVVSTADLRIALDTILVSNNADQNRHDETQAFFYAYAEALKSLLEQPDASETALYEWLATNGLEGDNWSFIYGDPGDWLGWLETTPQATLADNIFVFRNTKQIAERMANDCRVWKSAGFDTPECEPETYLPVINPTYVQTAASISELATTANPVNDTFLFTSQVDIPEITQEDVQAGELLATLPFEKIPFLPDDINLTGDAKVLLDENVCPIMQASPGLVLNLTGSAALPPDRPGRVYNLEGSLRFAGGRADSVKTYLTVTIEGGGCGIDPDRILTGTVEPAHPRSSKLDELEADRFVQFELISIGY